MQACSLSQPYDGMPVVKNNLFAADNLSILQDRIVSESVDLVYLDPPFTVNKITTSYSRSDMDVNPHHRNSFLKIRGDGTRTLRICAVR
jgi:16S rRNA G966 N2-methylase RsmD